VWLEAIRNGSRGADDLTNYIYAITNYVTFYDDQGKVIPPAPHVAGYTYLASSYDGTPNTQYLTNAMRIVGILSTPEYTDGFGGPPMSDIFKQSFASNHVVAYVRSISGLAAEKPPQPSDSLLFQDTLTYRLFCVNAPMASYPPPLWVAQAYNEGDTVSYILNGQTTYWQAVSAGQPSSPPQPGDEPSYSVRWVRKAYLEQLARNLRELRLTFLWPQYPNGKLGPGRQTFRATIAGQLTPTNYYDSGEWLYFYQSQSFTNAP
jgi:hypothetical protein